MQKTATGILAAALAMALPLNAWALPRTMAVPSAGPGAVEAQVRKPYGNAWQPQYSTEWRRFHGGGEWRGRDARHWRPDYRRHRYEHRRDGRNLIVPGIIGGIIGGAIANTPRYVPAPAPVYRGDWQAHVAWCDARYRTYRVSDNSFIPRPGIRQQCVSPYS